MSEGHQTATDDLQVGSLLAPGAGQYDRANGSEVEDDVSGAILATNGKGSREGGRKMGEIRRPRETRDTTRSAESEAVCGEAGSSSVFSAGERERENRNDRRGMEGGRRKGTGERIQMGILCRRVM